MYFLPAEAPHLHVRGSTPAAARALNMTPFMYKALGIFRTGETGSHHHRSHHTDFRSQHTDWGARAGRGRRGPIWLFLLLSPCQRVFVLAVDPKKHKNLVKISLLLFASYLSAPLPFAILAASPQTEIFGIFCFFRLGYYFE